MGMILMILGLAAGGFGIYRLLYGFLETTTWVFLGVGAFLILIGSSLLKKSRRKQP